MSIIVIVFDDAAYGEIEERDRQIPLGWFRDEVQVIAAACERVLLESAIQPELRHIPGLEVRLEYRKCRCGRSGSPFHRGIRPRAGALGRRMVMVPWGANREWLGRSGPK